MLGDLIKETPRILYKESRAVQKVTQNDLEHCVTVTRNKSKRGSGCFICSYLLIAVFSEVFLEVLFLFT